uniref:Zn(2)-C6 fungal-type domain-containing protein n=1 Tax=Bionectria ochroleuca TaxID=29856 RepID=A0A8H7N3N2_BIOOC
MKRPARARLRTKTGCLTCRQRRVKCDEALPICQSCGSANRECRWPKPNDNIDRRFLSHCQSRHHKRVLDDDVSVFGQDSPNDDLLVTSVDRSQTLVLHSLEPAMAHQAMTHVLEPIICRHFVDTYYGLIILPGCHSGFYHGWLTEILRLMASHNSLYYSVLACATSHLHSINEYVQMRELALTYYSRAITKLSQSLVAPSQPETNDGLLTSIILLYIHGCMGWGTYSDIPRHLNAAMSIIALRLLDRPMGIDRLFDFLAVESVLYHIFHMTTGLWTELSGPNYDSYIDFWYQAENLLDRSSFTTASRRLDSPVIGIPIALFRLALLLRQQRRNSLPLTMDMQSIRSEVLGYEMMLFGSQELQSTSDNLAIQEEYYKDARSLYAIIVSLLWKQMLPHSEPGPPLEVSVDCWQIRQAIQVFKKYEHDDGWARCFIGNWPTYTLGFFMSAAEDKEVIQAEMQRRWDLTKFAQVNRYIRDLQSTWAARQSQNRRSSLGS